MFLQDVKTAFRRKDIREIGTALFPLVRKSVSISHNDGFFVKTD